MQQYRDLLIGENKLIYPGYEFIIKTSTPRCILKWKVADGSRLDYEEFIEISEVQWIDGEKPLKPEQERIRIDMYNFLCLDEELLDYDPDDI